MADMTNKLRPQTTEAEKQAARELLAKLRRNPKQTIWEHGFLGHAQSSHVDTTDKKLLDNMLFRGKKNGDTVFKDKETAQTCIEDTLTAKAYTIAKFVNCARPGDTITFYWQSINDEGEAETVGHGFVGKRDPSGIGMDISKPIRAVQSNMAAVIITKDPRVEDGWKITTAFPMSRMEPQMNDYEAEELQITTIPDYDFESVLHQTDSYQHATPIQRALLDYNNIARKDRALLPVTYMPRNQGRPEQIKIPVPGGRYAGEYVYITGDDFAAVATTGSFPMSGILKETAEYLANAVNQQITQVEDDRRSRKQQSRARDTNELNQDMKSSTQHDNNEAGFA